MKSASLTINLPSADELGAVLRRNFEGLDHATSRAGIMHVFLVEKLYFWRNNSQVGGVATLEEIGEGTFLAKVWAVGGGGGLLRLDYGAEKKIINQLVDLILGSATGIIAGPEFSWEGEDRPDRQ